MLRKTDPVIEILRREGIPIEIAKIGIPPLVGIVATILSIGILTLVSIILATPGVPT